MKFVTLFPFVLLAVSCKMGATSGEQSVHSGKSLAPAKSADFVLMCESNSEKSGTQIFEKAVLTEKAGMFEIVYDFKTKAAEGEKIGKEVIVGKRTSGEQFVSGQSSMQALLEDSSMVTSFEGNEVTQKFDKLALKLEGEKLHLSDNGAVVLELSGCRVTN
jgi:hypothetical protein